MGTKTTREHKINWLLSRIRAGALQNKIIQEKKLVAQFSLENASSSRTAVEILEYLERADQIKRVDGMIMTIEQFALEFQNSNQSPIKEKLNPGDKQ